MSGLQFHYTSILAVMIAFSVVGSGSFARVRSIASQISPELICKDHGGEYVGRKCRCAGAGNQVLDDPSRSNNCGTLAEEWIKKRFFHANQRNTDNMCLPVSICGDGQSASSYSVDSKNYHLAQASFQKKWAEAHYKAARTTKRNFGVNFCWELEGRPREKERKNCLAGVRRYLEQDLAPYMRQLASVAEFVKDSMMNYLKHIRDNGHDLTQKQRRYLGKAIEQIDSSSPRMFPHDEYPEFAMQKKRNSVYIQGAATLLEYGLKETVVFQLFHEYAHFLDYNTNIIGGEDFRTSSNLFAKLALHLQKKLRNARPNLRIEKGHLNETVAEMVGAGAYFFAYSEKGATPGKLLVSQAIANYCPGVFDRSRQKDYAGSYVFLNHIIGANETYRKGFGCSGPVVAEVEPRTEGDFYLSSTGGSNRRTTVR